jgi:hypothetical protein
MPKIDWVVSPAPAGQVLPYSKTSPGTGAVSVQTAGTGQNGLAYPAGNLIYQGMPASSAGFGIKTVTMTVNGQNSEPAAAEVFFNGTAANHPNPDGTPNWYYYYNQIYPSPGTYTTGGSSTDYHAPNYAIHIGPDAFMDLNIAVFTLAPGAQYPALAGFLEVTGLHTYVQTCSHERGHQIVFQHGGIYCTLANGDPDPAFTTDGDSVNDAWEITHHLDPTKPDTTGAYPGARGDDELLADIQSLNVLLAEKSLWNQDWAATPGIQSGQAYFELPYKTPVDFYWKYWPKGGGGPVQVRSLADLPANTITNLAQLGQWP